MSVTITFLDSTDTTQPEITALICQLLPVPGSYVNLYDTRVKDSAPKLWRVVDVAHDIAQQQRHLRDDAELNAHLFSSKTPQPVVSVNSPVNCTKYFVWLYPDDKWHGQAFIPKQTVRATSWKIEPGCVFIHEQTAITAMLANPDNTTKLADGVHYGIVAVKDKTMETLHSAICAVIDAAIAENHAPSGLLHCILPNGLIDGSFTPQQRDTLYYLGINSIRDNVPYNGTYATAIWGQHFVYHGNIYHIVVPSDMWGKLDLADWTHNSANCKINPLFTQFCRQQ